MIAQDYNTTDNFYFVYRNTAGNMMIRPIVYNSSYQHYYYGSEYGIGGNQSVSSQCVYCGVNDDGTVIVAGRTTKVNLVLVLLLQMVIIQQVVQQIIILPIMLTLLAILSEIANSMAHIVVAVFMLLFMKTILLVEVMFL